MPRKKAKKDTKTRRVFTQEFKNDAVQMLLDAIRRARFRNVWELV